MIKIDKGIPLLPFRRAMKNPFDEMGVGDSFMVKGVKRENLAVTAAKYGKKSGKAFLVREVEGGVRCWRIE